MSQSKVVIVAVVFWLNNVELCSQSNVVVGLQENAAFWSQSKIIVIDVVIVCLFYSAIHMACNGPTQTRMLPAEQSLTFPLPFSPFSQINVDDIALDLIDTSSLKIVVMTTVVAEASIFGGAKLTLRLHPEATVGHLQAKVGGSSVILAMRLFEIVEKTGRI